MKGTGFVDATTSRRLRTVTTLYGLARVNPAGRVLWAEWDVWRHSADLVESGLWTSKVGGYGPRERIEFYVVDADHQRAGSDRAGTTRKAEA